MNGFLDVRELGIRGKEGRKAGGDVVVHEHWSWIVLFSQNRAKLLDVARQRRVLANELWNFALSVVINRGARCHGRCNHREHG